MLSRGSKGRAVRMAQKKLHNGAFGNFKPGVANGHFGRKTAAACRRAKYWLGYKRARCTGTYGKELEHWLSSYGHLPEQMRARRRKRINRRRRLMPSRARAPATTHFTSPLARR